MPVEDVQNVGAEPGNLQPVAIGVGLEKTGGQGSNRPAPFTQRRDVELHDVKPVVEVGTKLARGNRLLKRNVARRNQPCPKGQRLDRAHRLEAPSSTAQQLGLEIHRQRVDFIQQ